MQEYIGIEYKRTKYRNPEVLHYGVFHKANHINYIYWPAKERLQNIDAICFIVKTKNSNGHLSSKIHIEV